MASITRYDPFQEALSLRNAMDRLFGQSFVNPNWFSGSESIMVPVDVMETDNGYEVDIALPGVKPEDIELTVEQNTLTVKGRYSHRTEDQASEQGQRCNWLMREIPSGSFQRTITLPKPIDPNNIQANYNNGVLTVTVPISEASRGRRISVSSAQSQPQQVTVESGNPQR